uniref:Uncharacterized protein n=1 Tax=Serratia phage Kevin TaxID=3161161 RepID=A0AAU8KWS3_9CAUD
MIWFFFVIPVLVAACWSPYAMKVNPNDRMTVCGILGAAVFVAMLLQGLSYYAAISASSSDVEVLNGKVLSKSRERVSCEHSYECNCYYVETCSGSGTSRSCTRTRHCSTCYEHSYDVDWDVQTSVGTITINRIDRQGLGQPPRWTNVVLGEPVSRSHSYSNYILGNRDSLFAKNKEFGEKFKDLIPEYPEVYDYYRFNRVLNLTGAYLPTVYWNSVLNDELKTLGPARQVNIILVVTKDQPAEFFNGLIYNWAGGKKNDVIVVVNVDGAQNITWVRSTSFADGMDNMELHHRIEDKLLGQGMGVAVLKDITNGIAVGFNRVSMEKMEYLKWRPMSTWESVWVAFIGLLLPLVAGVIITRRY